MSDYRPELFNGDTDAAAFVADLCFIAHVWDDLIDKDVETSEDRCNRAFEKALVSLPSNPFYQRNLASLLPLIYSGVLGYLTANHLERSKDPHAIEIAHGLRYAVAQVAAFAIAATNPRDRALELLPEAWKWLMPERFSDYLKEHSNAA